MINTRSASHKSCKLLASLTLDVDLDMVLDVVLDVDGVDAIVVAASDSMMSEICSLRTLIFSPTLYQ
jgi:hypothetical protein